MSFVSQPNSLNSLLVGILAGFLIPVLFFFLYFLFRFQYIPFESFIKFLVSNGKIVHVMSLSVVPNLAPFFLFLNSNRFRSAKGILGATIFIALVIFIIKFL